MSTTASDSPTATSTSTAWLRAALTRALWCWLTIALAFGLSRAIVGIDAGLDPLGFAAYAIVLFVVIPALPAFAVLVAVASAQRAAPPAWVHVALAGVALAGWTYFGSRSLGWALIYAAAGALAAALSIVARSRRTVIARMSVMVLGAAVLGAAWYGLESLG